jgi:D-aminopeptidase
MFAVHRCFLIIVVACYLPIEVTMRCYISGDIEGMLGFKGGRDESWRDVQRDHMLALVEGLHEAGATHIRAKSFHGMPKGLPDYVEIARGKDRREFDLPEIDSSFDGMLMLGFHGLEGDGAFGHSYRYPNLFVNGQRVGEIAIQILRAAQEGVPTVLMTGDRFSVNEALMYSPEAVTLIEREGVDADEGDQDAAILEKVREVAREVVRKKGQIPLPELPDRYDLGVPFRTDLQADLAEELPYSVSRDGRVVTRSSESFREMYDYLLDSFQVCNRATEREKAAE